MENCENKRKYDFSYELWYFWWLCDREKENYQICTTTYNKIWLDIQVTKSTQAIKNYDRAINWPLKYFFLLTTIMHWQVYTLSLIFCYVSLVAHIRITEK